MESSQSTSAIIALEDDAPEVLFEVSRAADIHLWPLMRMSLARASAFRELGTAPIRSKRHHRSQHVWTLFSELILPNRRSSRHVPKDADTLFIVNGTTMNSTVRGHEDWLVGELAANSPGESVILQDRPFSRFPNRRDSPHSSTSTRTKTSLFLLGLRLGETASQMKRSNTCDGLFRR